MEEQLIVEVEKRPVLYDKSLGTYKNPTYREEIWKEVVIERYFYKNGKCIKVKSNLVVLEEGKNRNGHIIHE